MCFSELSNLIQLDSSFCDKVCTGGDQQNCDNQCCGGDYGAISVYPYFPANSMKGLTVTAKSSSGSSVTDPSPQYNTLTGDAIYLEVTFGSFVCKSATPTCLIGSDKPPVEIQVMFGCVT